MNTVLSHGLSRLAARLSNLKSRLQVVFATELAGHVAAAVQEVVQAVFNEPRGMSGTSRGSASAWNHDPWDDDPWEQEADPRVDDDRYNYEPRPADGQFQQGDTTSKPPGARIVDWWRSRQYRFLTLVGVAVGILGLISQPVFHATLAVLVGTSELLSSATSRTST